MVNIEIIDTGAPKAGPYNLGIKAGNMIFISGQVPSPEAKGIKEKTKSVFEKIKKILAEAKVNFSNIVKVSVFLKNMSDFKEMNQVYKEFFEKNEIEYWEIMSLSGNLLTKLINLIYLLDYSSIYRSVLDEIDPHPVKSIDFIKERL